MKNTYRALAVILALIMAVSVLSTVMTVVTAANDDNIASDKPATIKAHHMTALGIYGNISEYEEISLIYSEIYRWFFCKFSSDEHGTSQNPNYFVDGNAPGGHKHLNSHGTNLDNVLEYLKNSDPEYYARCINEINSMIPAMKKKKNLEHRVWDTRAVNW